MNLDAVRAGDETTRLRTPSFFEGGSVVPGYYLRFLSCHFSGSPLPSTETVWPGLGCHRGQKYGQAWDLSIRGGWER